MWRKKYNTELNKIVNGHTIGEISESKNWFLKKINKCHQLIARIMKKSNTYHQYLFERWDINIDMVGMKRNIRKHKENFTTISTT